MLRAALLATAYALLIGGASAAERDASGQIAYIGKFQGSPAIYLANADGSGRTLLVRGITDATEFSWSPDGNRLAVTRGGGSHREIWLVNADGGGLVRLTHSAGKRRHTDFDYSQNPSWSPDGDQVSYDGQRGVSPNGNVTPQSIYVIGVDGSGEQQLTRRARPVSFPAYAPDGRILFEESQGRWSAPDPSGITDWEHNGRIDLYTMNADGSGKRRIARIRNEFEHCACAAWSPDGTQITYEAAEAGGKPDIWVMNADGSGRRQLTHHPARDENPDWSPDGSQIAFYSERTGNGQIWIVNADGTGEHRITHDPWYDEVVRWRPTS
jgi:TolB protein